VQRYIEAALCGVIADVPFFANGGGAAHVESS
jgi:hypothetical protein